MLYKEVHKCRSCGSDITSLLELGNHKLTGIFPDPGQNLPEAPVTLMKCVNKECGLVQLKESVDPNLMYGKDYGYRTGLNKSMYNHVLSTLELSKKWITLESGDVYVDCGSNDGSLVNHVFENTEGVLCVGVDPTICKFAKFYNPGVVKVENFFNFKAVSEAIGPKKIKLLTSLSMFYDLEDPNSFVKEVNSLLSNDGVWVFEQAYLGFMLNRITIDTILSEHLLYYDLKSIDYILSRNGMKIIDVELNDINAGSLRVTAVKDTSKFTPSASVALLKNYEEVMGFNDSSFSIYKNFVTLCENFKSKFQEFLNLSLLNGKSVYALGASTKFNCILQYVNASPDLIKGIGEVNPDKFGKVTPGTQIPILSEDSVLELQPNFIVIGCYHFKEFFLNNEKIKKYISSGGTVVFPLPNLEFYNSDTK